MKNCTHDLQLAIEETTTTTTTTDIPTESAPVTTQQMPTSTTDADGDLCTGNDGNWKCGLFDTWESYQSYLAIASSRYGRPPFQLISYYFSLDEYDLYEYRGRRDAPMTTHGICEESVATTKQEKTTKKTMTLTSDAKNSILNACTFFFIFLF